MYVDHTGLWILYGTVKTTKLSAPAKDVCLVLEIVIIKVRKFVCVCVCVHPQVPFTVKAFKLLTRWSISGIKLDVPCRLVYSFIYSTDSNFLN